MTRLIAVLILIGLAPVADATNLTLSWSAVTTYTDTTSIAAGTPVTYNVYGAMQGQPLVLLTPTAIAVLTNSRSNVNPGTLCYAVSAIVDSSESAQTAPVCVTVATTVPSVPGSLTVTLVTSSTIAYMLVPGKDIFGVAIVGSVPLSTPCDATQIHSVSGVPYYVIPSASVTLTGPITQLTATLGTCH
jgi:Flp pilus assembly protein TadG